MRNYPDWLKKSFSTDGAARTVHHIVAELGLDTVCESAVCPNMHECFGNRQLTFMIMGDRCTRHCRFCAVNHAKPNKLSADEPHRVAEAVSKLRLSHVVITSVDRDDLPDEGAAHFAETVLAVKERNPEVTVEVLTPDFHAKKELIGAVMASSPEVFAHNIETVERL
jgi:lipoyl synthase